MVPAPLVDERPAFGPAASFPEARSQNGAGTVITDLRALKGTVVALRGW